VKPKRETLSTRRKTHNTTQHNTKASKQRNATETTSYVVPRNKFLVAY
jgi:hypothetical protein